jgi:hypothetical protein
MELRLRFWLPVVLAAFLASFPALSRARAEPPGPAEEFTKAGRFSARFPGRPGETVEKDAVGNPTHTFSLITGGGVGYTVRYQELGAGDQVVLWRA